MWQQRYRDREEAGRLLAEALKYLAAEPDGIVLALPRGGVPVGREIATALDWPLDVLIVRKLGVPSQPELAMGAIASGGALYVDDEVVRYRRISPSVIESVAVREAAEVKRREAILRPHRPPLNVRNRTVILVDDGVATGSTMLAGIRALRAQQPRKIVVAVPVASTDAAAHVRSDADAFVCLDVAEDFFAVGQFYEDFRQITDAEVTTLLENLHSTPTPSA